jgi:FeS assembly SUF system regulator
MAKYNKPRFPMLRLGKLTDYAILILSQMARHPDAITSATSLAESVHLTGPTVSKVLKILAEASLVSSVRGAEGGYHLAKLPTDITLVDIIAAMEGELAMTECCESVSLCAIDSQCTLRGNWQKINRLVKALLMKFTLIDMLEPLSMQKYATLQGPNDGK